MPFVTLLAGWETDGLCVAKTAAERNRISRGISGNFKYFLIVMLYMKDDDKFWARLREWQKDPEFRKGVKEFVKLTTSKKRHKESATQS